MVLKRGKVYKVKHPLVRQREYNYERDYIIFSPREDIILRDDYFGVDPIPTKFTELVRLEQKNLPTIFTVCFNGNVIVTKEVKNDITQLSSTGIDRFCNIIPLKNEDYKDIRKAIGLLGNRYKYNRKLNEIREEQGV